MGDSNIVVISFHIRIILNIRNVLVSHIYILDAINQSFLSQRTR